MGFRDQFAWQQSGAAHVRFGSKADIAPPQSITSSASASNLSGICRPRDLAVLRLMVRSNLVGCRIGRAAGFSPFKLLRLSVDLQLAGRFETALRCVHRPTKR